MIYNPPTQSRTGIAPAGHPHVMRIISWTEDGPLKALMGCVDCTRTAVAAASRKIRKIPAGFTTESWEKFLVKGDERGAQLSRG